MPPVAEPPALLRVSIEGEGDSAGPPCGDRISLPVLPSAGEGMTYIPNLLLASFVVGVGGFLLCCLRHMFYAVTDDRSELHHHRHHHRHLLD
jgi:hypothetical protein